MSLDAMMSAFQRHLPVNLYRFVGGPFDGRNCSVRLTQNDLGSWPPDYWHVNEELEPSDPVVCGDPIPMTVAVRRHVYRFVPTGRVANQGHYEWAGEARQLDLFPARRVKVKAATSPIPPRNAAERQLLRTIEDAARPKPRYSSAHIRRLMTPLPRITVPR